MREARSDMMTRAPCTGCGWKCVAPSLARGFLPLGIVLKSEAREVSSRPHAFPVPPRSQDTKMARSGVRPFMYTLDQAADVLEQVLQKRPLRFTRPLSMALLVRLLAWFGRWRVLLARGPTSPRA